MTAPVNPTEPADTDPLAHPHMTAYLAEARWFAGKGRDYEVVAVERIGTLPGPPLVTVELVTVRYPGTDDEPDTAEIYQMPLAHYPGPQERIAHALVGPHVDAELESSGEQLWSYDAVHDHEAMAAYLAAFAATEPGSASTHGGLTFHRLPGHELDVEAKGSLFRGEQSNSSIAFGEDSLLKVFRRLTPGRNPDIEIHRALTETGSGDVAALYGWLEAGELDLALLQQFLRTAADGWELALSSARAALADGIDEAGQSAASDFTGEAERLGAAVAEVHAVLREQFPVRAWNDGDLAALAEQMQERLAAQSTLVPELAPYAESVGAIFDRVAALSDLDGSPTQVLGAQRVHGDLHLGQTLRTVAGWKLVDFEGEPAKALAERQLPDSVWRDVAGMLRSFDYAARTATRDLSTGGTGAGVDDDDTLAALAGQWRARNREAFLAGYLGGRQPQGAEEELLAAYEADKAVYEAGYEARQRPSWLPVPLAALAALAQHSEPSEETS